MHIERYPSGRRLLAAARMTEDLCRDSECTKWWSTDPDDVREFVLGCATDATGYCAVVVDDDSDKEAGCLLGFIGEVPFNRSVKVSREVVLWVDEDFRGRRCGELLAKDFIAWSTEQGATLSSIGSTYGFGEAYVKKIADSLGFELQETMYLRSA